MDSYRLKITRMLKSALLSILLCAIVLTVLGSGFARADGDMFNLSPLHPAPVTPFSIYLNNTSISLATITITDSSGNLTWSETLRAVNGSMMIGPLSLKSGNYTLFAVFWSVDSTADEISTFTSTYQFTVESQPDKYTPIQVIIVGISFVFLVLGVLAMFTFLSGRLLPQEAPKPVVTTPSDEGERIAAIAAVIKLRGK